MERRKTFYIREMSVYMCLTVCELNTAAAAVYYQNKFGNDAMG